ncbi:hypothetical protein LTR86_009774 [Recurvomyces mirabilis]|nr:hypothetical protein LTR86_009774 [Recurvomyces mirabilis]
MPSNAHDPLFANTALDRGALPVVLGYIGAAITVLVTLIRVFLTLAKKHELRSDDYFFLSAAVLALVSSITLERSVDEGLGRHADTLNGSQLTDLVRFSFATNLVGIFAQAAAKISVAFLFERIAPRQDKRGIAILLGCICAWVIFAIFGTAFACSLHPSATAKCGAGAYVIFPIIVTDLITDAMLALWMVPRLWKLQADIQHRLIPIMLMSSRLLVCFVEIGLLVTLGQQSSTFDRGSPDYSWEQTTTAAVAICVVHLSVITATIPRINSFVADVQTKKAGLAFTQRDYELYQSASKSGSQNLSNNRSNNRSPGPSNNRSHIRSAAEVLHGMNSSFRPDRQVEMRNQFHGGGGRRSDSGGDAIEMDVRDAVETSSQSSLKKNAVYHKTEFTWEEEYTGSSKDHR